MSQAPSPPNPANAARTSRLLEALHPVCSHDLPNQIVALQSLLQLFKWDEAANLTPQGQEYFDRLNSIAGKTVVFVQYLKELVRLQRQTPQFDMISVPQLVEEYRAEAQRLYPDRTWTWRCQLQPERIAADHRLLQRGLVHLLRSTPLAHAGASCTLTMETAPQPGHIAWTIEVRTEAAATAPPESALIEQRLALVLAQEFLAATDIACRPIEGAAAGATSFALEIPNRSPHG